MPSKEVSSGLWSAEQESMYVELSNPKPAKLNLRSDPAQTPPKKPIASTPKYGTRKRAAK